MALPALRAAGSSVSGGGSGGRMQPLQSVTALIQRRLQWAQSAKYIHCSPTTSRHHWSILSIVTVHYVHVNELAKFCFRIEIISDGRPKHWKHSHMQGV